MAANDTVRDAWTFATDEEGDLRLTDANTLAVTEGPRAIHQDLRVALSTREGEDPLDPEFGLDAFSATTSYTHLKREIVRTIEHDDHRHDRVDAVTAIDVVKFEDRHAEVFVTADLEDDSTTEFSITIGNAP